MPVKVATVGRDDASTEEDNCVGEMPMGSTVEERGRACSYGVRLVWE